MTAVDVSMLSSTAGPDLSNASAAEVIAAITKAIAVRPAEINAWLVAHGCRRFRFNHFVHDQFELVETKDIESEALRPMIEARNAARARFNKIATRTNGRLCHEAQLALEAECRRLFGEKVIVP